jgi:hypothetical protein
MGDGTYLQFTVYDCPSRQARVAQLMAGYLDTDDGLKVGETYDNNDVSAGSIQVLAGNLIASAPRCSFLGWEDPCMTGDGPVLGELIAYCPRYGRFDGECTGAGGVVLDCRQIEALITDARRDPRHQFDACDQIRMLTEVACGIPWHQDMAGVRAPRARRQAWLAVIDARHAERWRQREDQARELAADAGKAGLGGEAIALQAVAANPPTVQLAVARNAADSAEQAARQAAKAAGRWCDLPAGHLASGLRSWADVTETLWQGRRRP